MWFSSLGVQSSAQEKLTFNLLPSTPCYLFFFNDFCSMFFLCMLAATCILVKWTEATWKSTSAVQSDVICTGYFPSRVQVFFLAFFVWIRNSEEQTFRTSPPKDFCVCLHALVHVSAPLFPTDCIWTASSFICLSSYLDISFPVITPPAPRPFLCHFHLLIVCSGLNVKPLWVC